MIILCVLDLVLAVSSALIRIVKFFVCCRASRWKTSYRPEQDKQYSMDSELGESANTWNWVCLLCVMEFGRRGTRPF